MKIREPGGFVPVLRKTNRSARPANATAMRSLLTPLALVEALPPLRKATDAKARAGSRYFAKARGCCR